MIRHITPAFRSFSGENALRALPDEMKRLGVSRALIFCGSSMRRHPQAIARVQEVLGASLVGVFDGVREHTPLPSVEAALRAIEGAGADSIIAVGGGSAIVSSRAAAIMAAEGPNVREICTRRGDDGRLISPRLDKPKLPQWVVPSTPTTAYAKAGCAVLDPDTDERLALYDPKVRPRGVFFDPVIAGTAPVSLVRGASLDAFAKAIDGLQSSVGDPLAEALLAQGLRMIVEFLPTTLGAAANEHRVDLMLASLLCGQGSDYVGGSLSQALSHAAGPRSSTANGVVEALLLPYVMRFNAPVTGDKLARIADILSIYGTKAKRGTTVEKAVGAVEVFLSSMDVPSRLRDVGVPRNALDDVVKHTLDDWTATRVPRPADREELTELLEAAW